jgi:hypothetical protein
MLFVTGLDPQHSIKKSENKEDGAMEWVIKRK